MLGGPYNDNVRNRAPLIETEDFRDEGARRFWDDFSPPYYGFKKGPNDTWNYNSESFAVAQVKRYWNFYSNRISNTDPAHAKYSAYASIYFTDEAADGRQDSSEVSRVSGKVDAVRLPKEAYFVEQVMQNEKPDIHIIGHWSYPDKQPNGNPTVKTDLCGGQQRGQCRTVRERRIQRQNDRRRKRLPVYLPQHCV